MRQGSFPPQRPGGTAPGGSRSRPGRLSVGPAASRWAWCPSWNTVGSHPAGDCVAELWTGQTRRKVGCQSEFLWQMCSATLLGRVTSMLKFKGYAVGWAEMGLGCADPRGQALSLASRSHSITRAMAACSPVAAMRVGMDDKQLRFPSPQHTTSITRLIPMLIREAGTIANSHLHTEELRSRKAWRLA